jgi:hypothetical protein
LFRLPSPNLLVRQLSKSLLNVVAQAQSLVRAQVKAVRPERFVLRAFLASQLVSRHHRFLIDQPAFFQDDAQ